MSPSMIAEPANRLPNGSPIISMASRTLPTFAITPSRTLSVTIAKPIRDKNPAGGPDLSAWWYPGRELLQPRHVGAKPDLAQPDVVARVDHRYRCRPCLARGHIGSLTDRYQR